MRTMALGLALFGLPVVAAAFPLSHAAYRPQGSPAQATPVRAKVVTTERYALTPPPEHSQHRDDESGGVIRELRMGESGGARTVRCHGHRFPATQEAPTNPPKR